MDFMMEADDECQFMDVTVLDQSLPKPRTLMNKSNSEKDFNLFMESLSKSNSTSAPSILGSPALNNYVTASSSLLESPTSSMFAYDQNDNVMMEQIMSPTSSTFAYDQNVVSLLKAKLNQECADAFNYFEMRGLTTRKQDDLHDNMIDESKTKDISNFQGPTSDSVVNLIQSEPHVMPKESELIQATCESDLVIIDKHDFEDANQKRREINAESVKRHRTKKNTQKQQPNDDEKRRMNRDAAKRYRMRQKAKNQQTELELDCVRKQNAAMSSQNILLQKLVNDALVRQEKLKDEYMVNEMLVLNQSTPQNGIQFAGTGLTEAFMPNINQFSYQGSNFPCLPAPLHPMINNYCFNNNNNINGGYPTTSDDDGASTSNTQNNCWM